MTLWASCKKLGGTHTQDDFDRAIGDYVTPINGTFRDHQVWECPPNGQGVIALMLLKHGRYRQIR